MTTTIPETLEANQALAVARTAQARSDLPRYLVSAALAGAYVGVAVVVLVVVGGPLVAADHPLAMLVQGSVFGIAFTLVVFAGAELFSGNTMIMGQALVRRAVKVEDVVFVWLASLVGNLVGAFALAVVVNASGIVTTGSTQPGKPSAVHSALGAIALGKAKLSPGQLFFRAVLCNMLICLALWMVARAASDVAKLILLWSGLLAFVAAGFELSVANMTTLSLAALTGVGEWTEVARNLLYTIPGNIVGGAVVIGGAYAYLGTTAKAPAPPALPVTAAADAAPAVELVAEPTPARAPLSAKPVPAKRVPTKRVPAKRVPAKATAKKAPAKRGSAKASATSNGRGRG